MSILGQLLRWPFSDAKSYCARIYYSSSGTNSWDVYFVVMRNLDLHVSVCSLAHYHKICMVRVGLAQRREDIDTTMDDWHYRIT